MMEKCNNCGSDNISGSPDYYSGYIDTCMECGWWENDRPEPKTDWFEVFAGSLFLISIGLLIADCIGLI